MKVPAPVCPICSVGVLPAETEVVLSVGWNGHKPHINATTVHYHVRCFTDWYCQYPNKEDPVLRDALRIFPSSRALPGILE